MQLQALPLSVARTVPPGLHGAAVAASGNALANASCAFCGALSGSWQQAVVRADTMPLAACPLCVLACQLDRPRIDEEAALVWLPEMSQQALNTLVRHMHMQLRALGEDLQAARFRLDTPDRRTLYHARAALTARADAAVARLGSDRVSDLGAALLRLSPSAYARRDILLDGLRLLPTGRFFKDDEDLYPHILDTWLELSRAAPPDDRDAGVPARRAT